MSRWGDHRQGRLETGLWRGKGLEPCWLCPPVRCCPALSTRAASRLATELWKPSPYLHPHRCFPLHGHPPFPLGHQPLQLGNAGEAWFWIWNSCSRSVLITVWSFVCFLSLALDFSKETNGLSSLHTDKGKAVRYFILILAAGLYAPMKSQTHMNTCTCMHTPKESCRPQEALFSKDWGLPQYGETFLFWI